MRDEICYPLPEYKFDYDRIRKQVLEILDEYNLPQIGLTHSTHDLTEEEKLLESTGSILNRDTMEFKFNETDFTVFNERFKGTALHEMYQAIPNVGRFRIMTMDGPKCYTIHKDLSGRYHYVIETNKHCLFLFPKLNRMYNIPCDQNLYFLDTRHNHTFVNGSRERRIHLVLDDLNSLIKI